MPPGVSGDRIGPFAQDTRPAEPRGSFRVGSAYQLAPVCRSSSLSSRLPNVSPRGDRDSGAATHPFSRSGGGDDADRIRHGLHALVALAGGCVRRLFVGRLRNRRNAVRDVPEWMSGQLAPAVPRRLLGTLVLQVLPVSAREDDALRARGLRDPDEPARLPPGGVPAAGHGSSSHGSAHHGSSGRPGPSGRHLASGRARSAFRPGRSACDALTRAEPEPGRRASGSERPAHAPPGTRPTPPEAFLP